MKSAKQFQSLYSGSGHGVILAKQLRGFLQKEVDQFIYNALIVMVEDSPHFMMPTGSTLSEKTLWEQNVKAAMADVFANLASGSWLDLPIGLAFDITTERASYMLYGPQFLVDADLEPVLKANEYLVEVEPKDQDIRHWWLGTLLSIESLSTQLDEQAEKLKNSHGSYVKSGNFRSHRSHILGFQTENVKQAADVIE